MPTSGLDETRDYTFADKALALRERAGLTQRALAVLLGVSGRAIQAWEAGLSYPGAEHLKMLITIYLERGAFMAGQEEDEAAALWETARAHAPRRSVPFDRRWFVSLHNAPTLAVPPSPVPAAGTPRRDDWGEAPDAGAFYGRAAEVATLSRWLLADRCRLVGVLGMGGVGKTLLAARLAREVAAEFTVVYWRSLRNAPPVEEWLAGAIAALSEARLIPPEGFAARLALVLELLQARRGLLVLDNLETILESGAPEARYREGYAGYGEVLRRVGEHLHQGCLLLTGREAPPELVALAGERVPMRTLRLGGLGLAAGRTLLQDKGLVGDDAAWAALIAHYSGNPLALSVVGETINRVFGGDIAVFQAHGATVFGGIRQLLDEQVDRLSALEQTIGIWLAVEREPVGFAALVADLGPGVARADVVEAVEALARRSLLERGEQGVTFTLQPVVLDYTTTRLIAFLTEEILAGEPVLLTSHPLLKAQAKDYIRHYQERLIAQPLLERLRGHLGSTAAVERRLLALLEAWRGRSMAEQGFGPGNVVNLLRLLRGDLRGLDLSRLMLRHAYLQGLDAQDASMAGAYLADVVLAEAFNYPMGVALSADGTCLVVGTSIGEVCLLRVADRALLVAAQGHAGPVPGVAISGDGRLVASGSYDGTVKLWEAPAHGATAPADGRTSAGAWASASPMRLLASLQGHTGVVWCVALSADGALLASGGLDGTVRLWAASPTTGSPGRLLATLQGHTGAVWGVALSGDGRLIASASQDKTIKLWEVVPTGGRLLATLQGHTGAVWGVALNRDGTLLASGSQDGTVKLWEVTLASGRLLATLEGHSGGVWGVALSRDGRLVAGGSQDGTVRLWETAFIDRSSDRLLATLQGHATGIRGVTLSMDGEMVVSTGLDGAVKLWETASAGVRLLASLQGNTEGIWSVALSRDGALVVSGSQDGTVRLWETAPTNGSSGRLLATMHGHSGGIYSVTLSANRQLVASGGLDGVVRLWAAVPTRGFPGQLLATLQGHSGAVRGVALNTDGTLLASGSQDGTVKLWKVTPAGGRLLATLEGHTGGVEDVALSADGTLLASGSLDRTVKLWELAPASGRLLATLEGHSGGVWGVAVSGDGRLVVSGSEDGTVILWEAPLPPASAAAKDVTSAALWAKGSPGRQLATLQGHTSVVLDVALSGSGQLVASSSFDGAVKLWETAPVSGPPGQLLAAVSGHGGAVLDVALSADGQLVASGSYDGTVKLWDARGGTYLSTLRSDRHYERMDITGLRGVTEAQRAALLALGAVEQALIEPAQPTPTGASNPRPASAPVSAAMPVPVSSPAATRTFQMSPSNLPAVRTTFVGRAADLATLTSLLEPASHSGARLLTLIGVAGCGKTRLALATAEAVRDAYGDGVWLVELAPLPASTAVDFMAVARAMLAALGLQEQSGQALLDTLITYLQSRRLLLVLDNCEHLVAACAALATRLLNACPALRILSTSQQALGSADEMIWRVPPLTIPAKVETLPASQVRHLLTQFDAVQLFVERAQAVRPTFVLNEATAASVTAICRRLDGLPLALELAAARLNVLPVEEILVRLDDRFRLLRRGGAAGGDRHQTLQATLDWSYGLLDPAEQALLRRLAIFAGGWEVTAAEAVCGGDDVAVEAVLELLDELQDRSLLHVHQANDVPRYGMLETVRQYGLQQLERTGEAATLRDRHVHWCVRLAERAAPALLGPEQATWLARLDREHDNLRAALQWALDRGLSTLGLRLGAGLWQFWRSRSHLGEGRRWLAAVLALPREDDAENMNSRAHALEGAAWLAEDEHDFAQASALFAQSEALRRDLGQDERLTGLLINAAMEARARGDYARATTLLEQSLAQHRARGNHESIKRGGLGLSLARLALVLAEQGQHARATALYQECLVLHRELGDREGIGNALLGLGDIARDRGDTDGVRTYCEETLVLFRELGHTWVGFSLNNLALAAYLDGNLALAANRAAESEALFRGLQAGPSLAEALVTVGRVKGAQGEAAAARASLVEALTLVWATGPRFVVAAALEALGTQMVRQGHARHGVHLLAAAAMLRQSMGAPVQPSDRPSLDGAIAVARGNLGDSAFDGAWATGETLPLEEIVARAVASSEEAVE